MNKIVLLLVICVVAFVVMPLSSAATYYVSITGSDTNPGTQNIPWKTIQYASNVASAGSTVLIGDGVFNEEVSVNRPGITFKGLNDKKARVNGGFFIYESATSTVIQNLNITDKNVTFGAVSVFSNDSKIINNSFYDITGTAISGPFYRPQYPHNVVISGNYFYKVQAGITVVGKDWLIENNEIERLYAWKSSDDDYTRFFGTGHVFRNNYFHGTSSEEIGTAHVDCFQTWDMSYGYVTSNILIVNTTCINFHEFGMIQAQRGNVSNITITNNIGINYDSGFVNHSFGPNVENVPGMKIIHNTFGGFYWQGIFMKYVSQYPNRPSGVIKNNLLVNGYGNPWNVAGCEIGGCTVEYNLWWNTVQSPKPIPTATNIHMDPQLANYYDMNFRPVAGSPACTGGEDGTYIGALPCIDSVQFNPADLNQNGCIDLGEISSYVGLWLNGSGVTLGQVSDGVNEWMKGC